MKFVLCGSRLEDERHSWDEDGPYNRAHQPVVLTTVRHSSQLGRRTSRGEELKKMSSRAWRFPKT